MSDKKVATLFQGNPLVDSDMYKGLQNTNDKLGGSTFGASRRISIRGSKFRQMVNGDQMRVSKHDTMNIVIIDCAPVSRTYYEGEYNSEAVEAPVCWSADTDKPSEDVENPQAERCADCDQNIKGSGKGESRACRYSQKLAVALEGGLGEVYQLQLPATSIFGESKENEMPMQAYARFLNGHNTPAIAVVTEMRFDENADVPKLFFSPTRPLEEDELTAAVDLIEHEDTKNAITFRVFDTDKGGDKKKEEKPKVPRKKAVKKEAEGEVEEPTKKLSKKDAPVPEEPEKKLSNLVSQWDD